MPTLSEKIRAEMANIEQVLDDLEKVKDRSDKEKVVLAGIGGYLASVYNGIENILKQLLLSKGIGIPQTATWHKDLLKISVENGIISPETSERIGRYLFFRHFYSHGYGFQIEEVKLKPLMNRVFDDYRHFKNDIEKFI